MGEGTHDRQRARHLERAGRLRRDIAAYAAAGPTDEELALAGMPRDWSDLADGTNWEALYSTTSNDVERPPA